MFRFASGFAARFASLLRLVLVAAPSLLGLAAQASGEPSAAPIYEVRFTSINGEATSPGVLTVRAGDVITFSADVFKVGGACKDPAGCPQSREIEEFEWQADNRPNNTCKPSTQKDCLDTSDFQLNNYGVSFYVPADAGKEFRITVTNPSVSSGGATAAASILVRNADSTQPETTIYYYDSVLAGQGRWVYISGVRHWVPYTYQANWTPYQHGYWVWVEGDGMTWVSYDPWGFCTDHYGVWRHHLTYGWIWLPFEQPVYHPAVVSWYHGHNHIGWYPYYAGYPGAYRYGYDHGFNDGYWAGYQVTSLSTNRTGYTFGLTAVPNLQLTAKNVYAVRAADPVAAGIWGESARANQITAAPGGATGSAQRTWIEQHTGEALPTSQRQTVQIGSAALTRPKPVHGVPAFYQKLPLQEKANVPVGSMVSGGGDKPHITTPASNGKSVTHSPYRGEEPLRTRSPAVPSQDHPYAARMKMPKVEGHKGREPAKKPAHDK